MRWMMNYVYEFGEIEICSLFLLIGVEFNGFWDEVWYEVVDY